MKPIGYFILLGRDLFYIGNTLCYLTASLVPGKALTYLGSSTKSQYLLYEDISLSRIPTALSPGSCQTSVL